MRVSLAALPPDVLQDIAFLLASSSLPNPPQDIVNLLFTCSSIHDTLNLRACPQLYARIFRAAFDIDSGLHTRVPDSILTAELCHRYRVLWRTRRMVLSPDFNREEIWAAVRLVLESTGRNSKLLSANRFKAFMMSFVLQRLTLAGGVKLLPLSNDNTTWLAMWLLCLTLTHRDIVETPEETRNALRELLRFPTMQQGFLPVEAPEDTHGTGIGLVTDDDRGILLEKATPIIILIFALNEVVPIKIPTHVPETRAIAIAGHRPGPTAEDFRAICDSRTPLFAEADPENARASQPEASIMPNPVHMALYKSRLSSFLYSTYVDSNYAPGYVYAPGFLSGIWEGSFMISGEPTPTSSPHIPLLGQFNCLKPMQCAITEYICFSPFLPIPLNYSLDLLERVVRSSCFGYEKYSADSTTGGSSLARRDPSEALDVILLGETLPDHELAWGGFKFAGRIRSDGYMIMCREPKNHAEREGLGTWIFEGHLRYGVALVGQWRASISTTTYDLRGIFSLHKAAAAAQRD